MSLACTLFHFFSFHLKLFPVAHLLLPCTSLTQSVPIFIFLLRHSSSGLTQALVHLILFQSNPVTHIIFPPAVGRGKAQVQHFPRTHLLSPLSSVLTSSLILMAASCPGQPVFRSPDRGAEMSSVHPQSQQPFLTLVELFLPFGFSGQRGDALNRAVPASRPQTGVEFGFFPPSLQGPMITILHSTKVSGLSWKIEVRKSYPLLPPRCCKATQTAAPCCFWMPPATVGGTLCQAPVAAARNNNISSKLGGKAPCPVLPASSWASPVAPQPLLRTELSWIYLVSHWPMRYPENIQSTMNMDKINANLE